MENILFIHSRGTTSMTYKFGRLYADTIVFTNEICVVLL